MKKTYFKFVLFSICILFVVIIQGCIKLNPVQSNDESQKSIIPDSLDWKTVKELTCTIKVNTISGVSDNMIHVIRIFNSSLLSDGSLIASGTAKPRNPYVVKITLPTALQKIYVQEILPDGTTNMQTIVVTGYSLDINFISTVPAGASNFSSKSFITANVPVVDNDGDGVSSACDIDDNDPTVAFASYFPSASTWGTYIFEDLWPVKGDYDVNDMVLGFKVTFFTNSANLITKLNLDYNMRAGRHSAFQQ